MKEKFKCKRNKTIQDKEELFQKRDHVLVKLQERDKLIQEKEEIYSKIGKLDPLSVILYGPIFEEFFFRGHLDPLVESYLAAQGIHYAKLASIAITSLLFGIVHYKSSPNPLGALWAIDAALGGLEFSLLNATFGLPAAIASHCTNNLSCLLEIKLTHK